MKYRTTESFGRLDTGKALKATNHIVTFRVDREQWSKFLEICHEKDMSGSQVLRNYISLIVAGKLRVMDKKVWEHRKQKEVKTDERKGL